MFEGDAHSPGEISGDRSIGIVGTDSQLVDRVWEIAPDNTVRIIADGLTFSHVSAVGDVVHVVGFRPTTNGRGDQVLIRSRPSVAPVEIVISPDIDIAATPLAIITTVEGGAIVGSLFETYLVGSTSTTPAKVPGLTRPNGGVRGAHTVLTANSSSTVFVYDEAGGVPSLTPLGSVPPAVLTVLDPAPSYLPLASDWFILTPPQPALNECSLARVEVVEGVKQLVTFPAASCPGSIAGTLADGTLVTHPPIWLLRPDGPVHVVDNAQLVFDPTAAIPTVVGWTGIDSLGVFTCMASDPDRCWAAPGATVNSQLVFSSGTASTDDVAVVWFNRDELRFYVVRSIGPRRSTETVIAREAEALVTDLGDPERQRRC